MSGLYSGKIALNKKQHKSRKGRSKRNRIYTSLRPWTKTSMTARFYITYSSKHHYMWSYKQRRKKSVGKIRKLGAQVISLTLL